MDGEHRSADELAAGLAGVREAPRASGPVVLVVRRPAPGEREVVESAAVTAAGGLAGDGWRARGSRHSADGAAEPNRQLTFMAARAASLLAGPTARWPLAGDQLYVDLDLSVDHLPPGTRLRVGTAVVEVSPEPHTGCAKFTQRFGLDAFRLVQSDEGRSLRLRGMYARVVADGEVRVGDVVEVLDVDAAAPEAAP